MCFAVSQDCQCCRHAMDYMARKYPPERKLDECKEEFMKDMAKAMHHCEDCWNKHHKAGWVNGKSDWEDEKTYLKKRGLNAK